MSGSGSSAADDPASRILKDLAEHERVRGAGSTTEAAPGPSTTEPVVRSPSRGDALPDLPRYEFRRPIGEGATSIVWSAWDRQLKRPVAIKVLRDRSGTREQARFQREAQAAAGLAHPNVLTVFDAGESDGIRYIVLELVEGRSLHELLAGGGLPSREALGLLEKASRGVAAAHEKGIVHRDLKPANILVSSTGNPKVGDFGLAHLLDSQSALTRTGAALGTPLYMSPEQVDGSIANVTPRTDVYALGAILYEILVGTTPHSAGTIPEIYRRILEEEPAFPAAIGDRAPQDLRTIALKALEKDPARRYAGAAEFAEDLRRALGGERIVARPVGRVVRLIRRSRRHPKAVAVVVGAILGIAAVWALGTRRTQEANRQYLAEREQSVASLRETARLSLEAALQLREKGEGAAMRRYLPPLEQAYRGARERGVQSAEIDYLMGRMHRALMDDDAALGFQSEALRKDPDFGPSLYERAVLLLRKRGGAPQPGQDAPSPAADAPGHDSVVAGLLKFVDQYGRRAQDLPVGLKDVNLVVARGMIAHSRGKLEEARELLESAVRQDSLLNEAWDALARVTAAQHRSSAQGDREKRWLEQEKAFTEAIRKDRGYLPHLLARGDVKRDRGFDRANRGENPLPDFQGAEEDYSEAVRLNDQAAEAWMRRCMVRTHRALHLSMRNRDPLPDIADAQKDVDVVARLEPSNPNPLVWRSLLRVVRGDHLQSRGKDPLSEYEGGIQDARSALERHPNADGAHKRMGIAHVQRAAHLLLLGRSPLEDLQRARDYLGEAALRAPESQEIRVWRGVVHIRTAQMKGPGDPEFRDEFARAEQEFSRALQSNPEYARAWMWRGLLRIHSSAVSEHAAADFDRGREDLHQSIRLNRGLPEAWCWRGVLASRKASLPGLEGAEIDRLLDDAEQDLSQSLKLDPGFAEAWLERGRLRVLRAEVLERKGSAREAKQAFEAASQDLKTSLDLNPLPRTREFLENALKRAGG